MNRMVSKLMCWLILIILLVTVLPPQKSDTVHTVPDGLHAMPPHPDLLEKLAQEGRSLPGLEDKWQRGIDLPARFPNPPSGNFNLLAVAVDFSDNPSSVAATAVDNLIFTRPGPGLGSVADYFYEVSYASLTLVTVNLPSALGWKQVSKPYNGPTGYVNKDGMPDPPGNLVDDYGWGAFPQNLQGIVSDTLPLIDTAVNFSNYDNDNDGFVDGVVFIHAGSGAELTGSPNDIWSSAWNMSSGNGPGPLMTMDNVRVDNFLFVPEYWVAPGDQTIGVYCHEIGHSYFGLPDLYDTDYSSNGTGDWSLMSGGSWNGPPMWVPWIGWIKSGASPSWPDAWSRMVMGFDTPMPIDGDAPGFIFPPVETGPGLGTVLRPSQLGPKEYFLLENRQQMGFDTFLPSSGLLIWHVDEDKWNMWEGNKYECNLVPPSLPCCTTPCDIWHPLVALEQADGTLDLENKTNNGDTGDPFPGTSANTSFKFGTTPESGSYYASPCPSNSCIAVNNIQAVGITIKADLEVVCKIAGPCVNITPGNQIGWGQPGTDITYRLFLQNCNLVSDTLAISTNSLWPSPIYDWGTGQPITQTTVLSGSVKSIGITVTVPADASWSASDVFSLTVKSGLNPAISQTAQITTGVPNCTLVVDDDRSNPDVESAYVKALANDRIDFDYWDANLLGTPDLRTLAAHQAVVWFTGSPRFDTLNPRDETNLATYLDGGGQLFLSSQDYLYDVGRSAFSREYLHVSTFLNDTGPSMGMPTISISGAPGNPVGNGLGPFALNPQAAFADWIFPHPSELTSLAFVDQSGFPNGLTFDSGVWKTLFLAWPFENLVQPDTNTLMAAVMKWFGVPPHPIASFTPSATPACVGDLIIFTNNSQDATTYAWDFGDGGTSTLANPSHTYISPITATVELTGTNCCGYAVTSQTLAVHYAPTAGFTASADAVLVGNTVVFTNTSLNATSFLWDFGDGTTSTLANPSHAYTSPTTATVTLTASSLCRDDVYTRTVKVYALPVAGFTPSASTVSVGQAVNFTNTSTNATTYQWDFGDGVGASEMIHPSYTYTQTGMYTVTLMASNPMASDTVKKPIQVNPVKHYLYLPSVTNGTAGNTYEVHSWYDWLKGVSLIVVSLGVLGVAKWNPRKRD